MTAADDDELSRAIGEAFPPSRAPDALRAWAHERAREASTPTIAPMAATPAPAPRRAMAWRAAAVVACVALGWGARATLDRGAPSAAERMLPAELVDDHVRALATGHAMDVVSTDRHTVKPWFAGRADVAPRVESLDSAGFPLLGGRLSYVQGHRAAVLVYGRRLHTIDLYVWRAGGAEGDAAPAPVAGHALRHWTRDGLSYWAVTDASPEELEAFRRAYDPGLGIRD